MALALRKQLTVIAAGLPVASSSIDGIEVIDVVAAEPAAILRALAAARPNALLLRPADRAALAVIPLTRGVPVLVLTAGELVSAAMRAGARGVLRDDVGQAGLNSVIRMVAGGTAVFGKEAADRLYARVTGMPAGLPDLTARERDVLGLLAEDLDNQRIAARLNLAPKTVRNVVCVILGKFGTTDRARVAAQAREAGLRGR